MTRRGLCRGGPSSSGCRSQARRATQPASPGRLPPPAPAPVRQLVMPTREKVRADARVRRVGSRPQSNHAVAGAPGRVDTVTLRKLRKISLPGGQLSRLTVGVGVGCWGAGRGGAGRR